MFDYEDAILQITWAADGRLANGKEGKEGSQFSHVDTAVPAESSAADKAISVPCLNSTRESENKE